MTKRELRSRMAKVLAKAEKSGAQRSVFFVTTFRRYQQQMKMLESLEKAIDEYGPTVTKEYVKGRENLCINPAMSEYTKVAQAANATLQTLLKVIDSFRGDEGEQDALADFLSHDE